MKSLLREFIYGRNVKASALFAIGIFLLVGLGCFGSGRSGSSKPIPPAYLGDWTGQDGSTLSIRADGKGDYHAGSTKVEGGSVEIDETAKKLSVTFFSIGPTMKIDSAPSGDEMKLDGVVYRRSGGFSTSDAEKKSLSNTTAANETVKTAKTPVPDDTRETTVTNLDKADASKGEIPTGDELQEMSQKTLIDFNDAIEQEDFTDFFQTISKLWQRQGSPAKLKETFQPFIDKKVNIGGIRAMEARFTSKPRVDDSKGFKELIVEGRYDTSPFPTKFELKFTPQGRDWKLTGISVDTSP